MRAYRSPDGTHWGVEARAPGASNIMVVFRHPDASTSRMNRYAWINWTGMESRDVAAQLDKQDVLDRLGDDEIARLFRRSMPIATPGQGLRNVAVQSRSGYGLVPGGADSSRS